MSDKKYVEPNDILDPNAKPLTDQEANELLQDSWRTEKAFIKDHLDPVYVRNEKGQIVIKDDNPRPWGVLTFHLLKKPVAVGGDPNKIIYGYYKLRGPGAFVDDDEAHAFGVKIFQGHDSYSLMRATPYGVMQPLTSWDADVTEQEAIEHYRKEIESKREELDKFVARQRQAEERAREINDHGIVEGSIDDYVRQQLRWHAADKRIEKAKKMIEEAETVMDEAGLRIQEMLSEKPEYKEDGLKHFQEQMVAVGEPKPESYYDQAMVEIEKPDAPRFLEK